MAAVPAILTDQEKELLAILSASADGELRRLEGDEDEHEEDESSSSSSSSAGCSDAEGGSRDHSRYRRGTELDGRGGLQKKSQDIVATLPHEDELPSGGVGGGDGAVDVPEKQDDCVSDDDDDGRHRDDDEYGALVASSKSLTSNSSKSVACTTNPVSTQSLTSQSSSAAATSDGAAVITAEDYKLLQEKLRTSLREETLLLSLQQQLLVQLENLEQSIIKSESEERMARLAFQQAEVTRLLKNVQEADSESFSINAPL